MDEYLKDLYQELILDHSKKPRNFCEIDDPEHFARGNNPLCGDQLMLQINTKNNTIDEICFQGTGCAISIASASLMTEALKGRSIKEGMEVFKKFHKLLTEEGEDGFGDDFDKLNALSGVRKYPIRVKCATLAWHTLEAALKDNKDIIKTE